METEIISYCRENFESLYSEYLDPSSLMFKKLRVVDTYIHGGDQLLDVGAGIGELIELEKQKFNKVYGLDIDEDSIKMCSERFQNNEDIRIIQSNINNLKDLFQIESFDYITACDVLEHLDPKEYIKALNTIYALLKNNGRFIFTGPGMFDKIKILLGKVPQHKHSHSSYGWKRNIERTGFKIVTVESIQFPVIHADLLRKKLHIFGKCCLIVAEKRALA